MSGIPFYCYFVLFSFYLCTIARQRDASPPGHSPPALKLSDTKDAQLDGILSEINKVLIYEHMKVCAAEQSIAMFSEPGHHDITLDYEEKRPFQRTDIFIQLLIDSDTSISAESTSFLTVHG
jgi:hypothetical protein